MSHHHETIDLTDPDLQQSLSEFDKELWDLAARITNKHRAWEDHLTSSRPNGPHRLEHGTRIQTAEDIKRQAQALSEQIEAYNIRIRATCERGADHTEVAWADLLEPDEVRPISTEVASSFTRRIIISARLELCILTASLRKMEDVVSFAFVALTKMVRNISCIFQEWRGLSDACPVCLRQTAESKLILLKSSMAEVGMKMARQRVILEYFESMSSDSLLLHSQIMARLDVTSDLDHEEEPSGDEQDGDSGVLSELRRLADDRTRTDTSDAEANEEAEGKGVKRELRQTCVTDYFSALARM